MSTQQELIAEVGRLLCAHESAIRQHDRGAEWDEAPSATRAALLDAVRAMAAGKKDAERQHAFDCRTCAHFTAKGCYSTVACIEARQYKATAPRQYWAALAEGDGR